ncbi:MAG: hypothetical protein ACXWEY_04770 [Bacteroidia bacterium]
MLDNNLGVLTIWLPEEFDTSFKWMDVSDCRCCGTLKTRIQKSSFPIIKESGFFYGEEDLADSIYRFTIEQAPKDCGKFKKIDFENILINQKTYIYGMTKDTNFEISKVEKINGRECAILASKKGIIFELKSEEKELEKQTLYCFISNNNEMIKLDFNCAASNCDSFIPKMYKALKTVEIKPN